jgi:hypothetical protein
VCLKDPLGLPRSPRTEWEVSRRPPAKMSQSGPPDLRMTPRSGLWSQAWSKAGVFYLLSGALSIDLGWDLKRWVPRAKIGAANSSLILRATSRHKPSTRDNEHYYSGGPNTIGGRPRADRYSRITDPTAAVGSRTAAVSASESARSQGRRPP